MLEPVAVPPPEEDSLLENVRQTDWRKLSTTTFSQICETFENLGFEIKNGDYALDVGCGFGKTLVVDRHGRGLIDATGTFGRVVGIDISATSIKNAAENIKKYLKASNLEDSYALLVIRSAKELKESQRFLRTAEDQKVLEEMASSSLLHLMDEKGDVKENIKVIEEHIKKRLVILYQADAHKMEICPQNYFDKIFEYNLLMHTIHPFEIIKNCVLALKIGGSAYFTEFYIRGKHNLYHGSSFLNSVKGIKITHNKSSEIGYLWTFSIKKESSNEKIINSGWPKTIFEKGEAFPRVVE